MNGIMRKILERVVHPAHVPFHAKAQPADINWPRHHGPRGRFLRDGLNSGIFPVRLQIHLPQKFNGIQILASAKFVGNPFACLARVVEVEHGGNGIHAYAVGVILVQPEHGAGNKKAAHFIASVIEDVSVPIGMKSRCAGRHAQINACHQKTPARARRRENVTAPNRASRQCRAGADNPPDT